MWNRILATAVFLACAPSIAGCDIELEPGGLGDLDETALEIEARATLRRVFPDLSDTEIRELAGKLDYSAVLSLRDEFEKIRDEVREFSRELLASAEERVRDREETLQSHNDGYPSGLEAVGRSCSYDSENQRGEIRLSGVFNRKAAVQLEASQVQLKIDGVSQSFSLECLADGPSVDIVFLIDITGSMSNVIDSVRDSVVRFVDAIEASGVRGTVGIVTFQDSVGVNRSFQETKPALDYERSPFFEPVSLADSSRVEALRAFVNRLQANRGADAPENLAGAIDFARNNVIGYTKAGEPNAIGDKLEDPAGTSSFPKLTSERQVFVALTDITFHGDDRTPRNSSLLAPFVPRDAPDILRSLQESGTIVHVSDPSWVDASDDPGDDAVDADYWAKRTGGLGEDIVEGYSLVDLELVVVAEDSGLLDIPLDKIISSTCTLEFEAELSATASVELELNVEGLTFATMLDVQRF